jgi:diphosphomevalonate decarboxylase
MITDHQKIRDSETPTHIAYTPSNIAFLKYWGKSDELHQWPANDSLSMTLRHAQTITRSKISLQGEDRLFVGGTYQAPKNSSFKKSYGHLERLRKMLGFSAFLDISTENTFPSSCGIASSASGLGALTLAALAAWTGARSLGELESSGFDRSRLAQLAHLGSGSAGRSFWGGYVVWEKGPSPESQRFYPLAVPEELSLVDIIAVLSKEPKSVSSSEGHRSAWSSPLFTPRLAIHPLRMESMIKALQKGDLEKAGDMMETEALEMHAIMMTAQPSIHYLTGQSCQLITWIRQERVKGNLPAWFTIDAGPNIHVICAQKDREAVYQALLTRFESPQPLELLVDETGPGPQLTVE